MGTKTFSDLITFTRASSATYYDAQGVLQTAAVDEKRLTHDPATGESLGLLIEEQRTNLLLWSEAFDNAVWDKSNVSVTANSVTSPDGLLTADSIIEDTSNSIHSVSYSLSAFSTGPRVLSFFAKSNGRTKVRTTSNNSAIAVATCVFDLTNETVNGNGISIEKIKNGWFRCSVLVEKVSNNPHNLIIQLLDSSGSTTYTGDGTSGIYIWGAQLEAGSSPTSYIKTEASQVTRSADNASVDDLSVWFNGGGGTLFVDTGYEHSPEIRLEYLVGESSARRFIFHNGNEVRAFNATDNIIYPNYTPGVVGKVAISVVSDTEVILARNGVSDTKATTAGLDFLDVEVIKIGEDSVNGTFNSVKFIPRALSATELEALTAP